MTMVHIYGLDSGLLFCGLGTGPHTCGLGAGLITLDCDLFEEKDQINDSKDDPRSQKKNGSTDQEDTRND